MHKPLFYLLGVLLITALTAWIFFSTDIRLSNDSTNTVDNQDYQKVTLSFKDLNYYPNVITVDVGKPVRIYLDNTVGGCFRSLVISEFGVRKNLATPNDYAEFTPTKTGSFTFMCSMNMGRGIIVVK